MTKDNANAIEAGAIALASFVVPMVVSWALWLLWLAVASIGGE